MKQSSSPLKSNTLKSMEKLLDTNLGYKMSDISENGETVTKGHCPCTPSNTVTVPPFVGYDYFCESGSPTTPTKNSKNCIQIHYGMVKIVDHSKGMLSGIWYTLFS